MLAVPEVVRQTHQRDFVVIKGEPEPSGFVEAVHDIVVLVRVEAEEAAQKMGREDGGSGCCLSGTPTNTTTITTISTPPKHGSNVDGGVNDAQDLGDLFRVSPVP